MGRVSISLVTRMLETMQAALCSSVKLAGLRNLIAIGIEDIANMPELWSREKDENPPLFADLFTAVLAWINEDNNKHFNPFCHKLTEGKTMLRYAVDRISIAAVYPVAEQEL